MKMIKTTIMGRTKNTLLNTISAQITYPRGALIALFAGLFILAACGGGAAPTDITDGGTGVDCNTNIFDPACGVEKQAEQVEAIRACITAISTGEAETCDTNIPMVARNCLNAPFETEGCAAALPASVKIETVQATRTTDCRAGTVSGSTCTGAIVSVCGTVSNTIDGVLFTETLCGTAYDASRTTLINNCRTAGDASDEACTSVVITTDATANQKALDCVLDAFAEGCDTNDDVANVVEKTDATIKPIVETRKEIETDCRGLADFATNSRCTSAIESTCDDNPFTLTTGTPPVNFCTGANDGRAALITRCSDTDTDCDKVVSTGVTVAVCVATPHATGCGDTAFNGLKSARYTHCTGATPTDDCSLVETTIICLADTAKASTRANPFSPLCRASSADYTNAQSDFCNARTDESLDECAAGFLTTCAANPLAQTCIDSGLYTEAGRVLTLLCTTDSTLFDDRCNGFTNTVTSMDIATTRDNICNTEATSFHAGCLGRTDGVAVAMRKALVITCRDDKDATGCDELTANLTHTVAQCAANPYRDECKDDANFADELGERTSFCADTAEYFNGLCDVAPDIDKTRETFCTVGATSFDTRCKQDTHGDVMAGQLAFAKKCRDSGDEKCISTKLDDGTTSVLGCVNNDANGDPYHADCIQSLVFEAEREARSLQCADLILTDEGNSLCTNARVFDLCINNPFGKDRQGADCDATVYMDVRNNRDTYCLAGGRSTDDEFCAGRKAYICDGAVPGGTPTADICGADNRAGEQEFCRTNGDTTGICESDETTACEANPFNGNFGAYRFDCTAGTTYLADRVKACRDATSTSALPAFLAGFGATIADCNDLALSGVICGTAGETGTDPFAPICDEVTATAVITGFNKDMEQQQFCGATRKTDTRENDCAGIYSGLCVGTDLFVDGVGAGRFDCSGDGVFNDARLNFCKTDETSFNTNCNEDDYIGTDAARESLAATCRSMPDDPGCDAVADAGTGRTVVECSGYTGLGHADGDPYQTGCEDDVFEAERTARALTCSMDDEANDALLCGNAIAKDKCIGDPFGNDHADVPCVASDYTVARENRERYCSGPFGGDDNPLCGGATAVLCDGNDLTDKPFAFGCQDNNSVAQVRWCELELEVGSGVFPNQNKPECTDPNYACSIRPFGTAIYNTSGVAINCLTAGDNDNGDTYRSDRQRLCAIGAENNGNANGAPDNDCDTAKIAEVVCGTSTGENSNPFAAFCATSENDGLNDDEAARLALRQDTLTHCLIESNRGKGVCRAESAGDIIDGLEEDCRVVGATSISSRCDYTQYVDTQKMYCAGADSNTVFDSDCVEGKHGEVLAARKIECAKTGSVMINDAEFCTEIVVGLCSAGGTSVLQSRTAASGYLCEDAESSTTYNDAREVACGVTGTGTGAFLGQLRSACIATIARICMGKEFTTAGMAGYDCAENTAFNGVREAACGATSTAPNESDCMATRLRLCTGDGTSLIQTASNGYDCSASDIDTVETERRRFCADPPQGGDTMGCPVVLAELCTGADSLLNGVATGDGATTYNCKDDGDDLVLYQRQEHCAQGTNDNGVADCPDVITTLCAEGDNSVQAEVATNVGSGKYDCSTSTVPDVITARKVHCRLGASNSDGLCNGTIATLCLADPFEKADEGAFGSLCVDAESSTTYANARKMECRDNGTEGDGQTGGKCADLTLKGAICDGDDAGDSPYAAVCGTGTANLEGQTAFCRIGDHSTSEMRCGATIATVCHVDTGDPFDTLCSDNDNDRATRATACFGTSATKSGEDCTDVATCNADPFGEDCDDTIYVTARTDYCETPADSFTVGCVNGTHGKVTEAQQGYCAMDGKSGEGNCPNVLAGLCTGADSLLNGVDTGYESVNYDCKDDPQDTVVYQRQDYCATAAVGTTGCPDVLATLCMKGDNSVRTDVPTGVPTKFYSCAGNTTNEVILARQTECKTRDNTDNLCTPTITDFCGADDNNPTDSNNLFNLLCRSGYEGARDRACLAADAMTAGVNNDCTTRTEVINVCKTDPFGQTNPGCMNFEGRAQAIIDYCTTGDADDIFDAMCLETDDSVYGDVKTARDNYCGGSDATPADGLAAVDQTPAGKCFSRKEGICGPDDMDAESNPFADLCGDNMANRITFCGLQSQMGKGQCTNDKNVLCTADPFGTAIGLDDSIDCTTGEGDYSDNREKLAEACRKKETPPDGTTCTSDIDDCNENPFRTDTFVDGEPCDAAAFDGAFEPYCKKTQNAWEDDCTPYVTRGGVMAARQTVCNTEATSFRVGCEDVAYAGAGLRDTARKALIVSCRETDGTAAGCANSFANGKSDGPTVGKCSLNPFNNADPLARNQDNDVCNTNPLFEAERVARIELCEVAATSFNELCDILNEDNTDTSGFDPITTARTAFCTENDELVSGDCDIYKAGICDGDEISDNPYASICDEDNVANQRTFCGLSGGDPQERRMCSGTIMTACDVTDGNPFHVLCTNNDGHRATRAEACRKGDKDVTKADECPTEVVECNKTPFKTDLGCDATIYAGALEAFCTEGADIFDTRCVNGTHGEVTAAQLKVCEGAISSLPSSATDTSCNHANLSGKICGDADTIGSKPFAEICSDVNRNSNHGVYLAAQQHACRANNDADGNGCADTIRTFCEVGGNAIIDNLFDDLCEIGTTYDTDRETYCTEGDKFFDKECDDNAHATTTTTKREAACRPGGTLPTGADCGPTIRNFCDATTADATVATFDSLCGGDTYDTAREKACKIYQGPLLSNCTDTIVDICTDDPFTQTTGTKSDLCVDASETTTYADAREMDCRLLINSLSTKGASISNCVPVLRDVCGELDNADTTAIFSDALCTASATYTPARIKFCSADNPTSKALTDCSASGDNVVNTICNGGDANPDWNPYADICAESTATAGISGFDLATAQSSFKVFCGGGSSNTNSSCPAVIVEVCSSASDTDLFSDLCDTGYTDARVAACEATDDRTGVYVDCAQLITDNCTNGSNPACSSLSETPASLWAAAARNADNSGTLNVLDAVGLNDAYTNYVQGGTAGLQLGAVAKGDGSIKDASSDVTVTFKNGTVSFADLDHLTDEQRQEASASEDGAAFAFIDVLDSVNDENSFTDNPTGRVDTRGRYYAGLFSGTDLGGPLIDDTANGMWTAAFAGYSTGGSVVNNLAATLLINYTAKEIETIDVKSTNDLDRVIMSDGAGSISIAGKFTSAGVIYGTSSWKAAGGDLATGSVTGLIGVDGAVGAFVSSGENDGKFEYTGGFVAAPVNCTDATTGTPFHRLCDEGLPAVMTAREMVCGIDANSFDPNCATLSTNMQRTAFAKECRTAPETKGCDRVIQTTPEITVKDCTNSTDNHPHQTGCEDAVFDDERGLRITHCLKTDNAMTAECEHGEVLAITEPCAINPFNTICDTYATEYQSKRDMFRENCGKEDVTSSTIGSTDCTDELILAELCVADGNGKPVSFLCDGYSDTITTIRETFCRDETTGMDVRCAPTRKAFCDKNVDNDNIFDTLCTNDSGTYNLARGEQCARTAIGTLRNRDPLACGSEGTDDVPGTGFLLAFCKTDAGRNYPDRCPMKAAEENEFVDTIDWEIRAIQNTGTADAPVLEALTVLDEVGADDAKDTNYVKAGTDGLNIADVVKNHSGLDAVTVKDCVENPSHTRCDRVMFSEQISTCQGDGAREVAECNVVVSASAGATEITSDTAELPVTSNAAGSGFAIARINSGAFTQGSRIKYYAGILSDTDLGNPVTSNTLKGKWDTNFSIIFKGQLKQFSAKLTVMLDEKTIKSKNAGILIGFFGNRLVIDGKFTDKGVIYGTSKITLGVATESGGKVALGTGTLTGLIGQKGAVGVFVSDGTTGGTANQYVGGFVADNPAVAPNCTSAGLLFNAEICAEDSHRQLRANLCQNRGTVELPARITEDVHCTTAEVKADICVTERNPFDTVICADAEYDAERGAWCVANPDQRTGECGNEEAGFVSAYCLTDAGRTNIAINRDRCTVNFCTYTNALHSVCNAAGDDVDATYAAQRHDLCAPELLKSTPLPICLPVIDRLCNAEPLNKAAGAGTADINCTTAIGGKYATAGQARITLCADGMESNNPLCMQESVTDITGVCTANPFDPICADFPTQYRTLREERIMLCADGTKSGDPRCMHTEVSTITTTCTDDPFASDCTPFAVQYTDQRTQRLNDCLTPSGDRANTKCTNADAAICSYYSPFDTICASNDNARRRAALACAPDNTRDKDYVLPVACDGIVKTITTDEVTVKDCVDDPMHARCDREMFMAQITACEGDATRAVAECNEVASASVVTITNVRDCVANPWNATDCPQDIFDNIVKAQVCQTSTTSFTDGCLTYANGFIKNPSNTRRDLARLARTDLINDCVADTEGTNTACDTKISGEVTIRQCIANPFLTECRSATTLSQCVADARAETHVIAESTADCRTATIVFALSTSADALAKRTALVETCFGMSDPAPGTPCATIVAGSETIESCTKNPFHADCSGDELAGVFNPYRAERCTTAATSFDPGCTQNEYSFTDTTTIKYRDTARAERALGCADPDNMEHNNCTDIVSGSLTVDMCNADPFAPGCESPAFTYARLEVCKGDNPPAACSVATALARTNYVTDLDANPASLYVNDTYVDDNSVLKEGVVVGGLNLNEVGYTADSPTDQSASGFAFAYIPDVRQGGLVDGKITNPSRYYAGVLAGTDVGAPPYDTTATGAWTGKLSLVNKGKVDEVDFTLDVDFTAQTIAASDSRMGRNSITRSTVPVKVDYAHTALGQFYIDGKFTTGGVIYGTTRLVADGGFITVTQPTLKVFSVPGTESSSGSLTGIIGQNGAVGAFVSSGEGLSVNTLGEYAGGFVAAPGLNCATNPLDIRCDSSNTAIATAQEDTCSDAEGLGNPACIPVFARVCIMGENAVSLEANHESDNARIQCRNAPQFQTKREEICVGDALINGLPTERCETTVATACMNDVFSEICNDITAHEDTRYRTCAAIPTQIFDNVIDINEKSADAISCNYLITDRCGFDGPFASRFCYISDKYTADRLAECADHNIPEADKDDACKGDAVIDGLTVNVVKTYCLNRPDANDDYGICNSPGVQAATTARTWRGDATTPRNVIGAGGAYRNDSGHIAGGVNRLELGGSAVETAGRLALRLNSDASDGIAIATGVFGGDQNRVLQSYGGLLATANLGPLGRPVTNRAADGVPTFWNAKIALAWQGSAAREASDVVILWNNNFTLKVTYGANGGVQTDISAENIALDVHSGTGAPTGATFTIKGHILNDESFITAGKVALKFSARNDAPPEADIHGVLARQRMGAILATFATTQRQGQDAYAGGFVAEDLGRDNCATNGTGNPFLPANGCSDAAKLAEATRCYANGSGSRPTDGDCIGIDRCFRAGGGELWAIAVTDTDLPMGVITNTGGIACQSAPFDGARAIACGNSPELHECTQIASQAGLIRTSVGGMFDICIARPFIAVADRPHGGILTCDKVLGDDAYAIARLERATDCMIQDNIVTHASGFCKEFIARVGTECANSNPFSSSCATTFAGQVNAGFAATAQGWRLSYCTRDSNEASDLCTGALTYCAVDVPDGGCGTLVTDYCLGGMGRTITDRGNACTDELATTCDVDPFNSLTRCVEEQKYIDARQGHCDGTTPVEGLSLDKCLNTGLDADICGDMDSLGSNPFAEVCNSASSNANFTMREEARKFYCSHDTIDLDTATDCESVVTSTCGVGGFGYTTTSEFAFDPLCRQETYDYARFGACRINSGIGTGAYYTNCAAFIDTICPDDAIGLIGCDGNANSTPTKVWTDNVRGIVAAGGITRGNIGHTNGAFVEAGRESLNLSIFNNPAQDKITLAGDDDHGVAFASFSTGGTGRRYFAGLLAGTNVGGPLVNNSANGKDISTYWSAQTKLSIGSRAIATTNFTLKVIFTGNGGTLTTQKQANHVNEQDVDLYAHQHHGNRFQGARMNINGVFNAEGVISGETDLYFRTSPIGNFTAQKLEDAKPPTSENPNPTRYTSTGRLTGLIGKTGAVGAFYGTTGQGNLAAYVGGFVATPGTAFVEGNDCTIGGAENDGGDFLFSSACDYATDSRALWCGGLTAFEGLRLAECQKEAIQKLVCKGTGAYANPFTSLVCDRDSSDTMTRVFTPQEIAANKLTFANQCDAGTATGDCSKDVYVRDCLVNPYDENDLNGVSCNTDPAFLNIRTVTRPKFCDGLMGATAGDPGNICEGALAYCAGDITGNANCGGLDNFVSRVCLATPNRLLNNEGGHCTGSIQAECDENPFHARCSDSIDKITQETAFTRYDNDRKARCNGFDEAAVLAADISVLDACNAYAPAICGYYVAPAALSGPRPRLDNCGFGGNREHQAEVIEIGSNPFAAICTNDIANRERTVELTKDEGGACAHAPNTYNQIRQGFATHASKVRALYIDNNCPTTVNSNVPRLESGCPVINVAGGDGYEAWEADSAINLVTAGNAINAPDKTNFIAGYGGGLFLGVGKGAVANAATFNLGDESADGHSGSGFAYATTGTGVDMKLFTGLLSGTTDLGGLYTSTVEVTWLSTLSFLTNQGGTINLAADPKQGLITKKGFALTLNYSGTDGTIRGIEGVGTGNVFQVEGTFRGHLLGGTVTFGKIEGDLVNGQFVSSSQSVGTLTGVIGVDGAVGVFKSNTGGTYGNFVGGFVASPAAPTTAAAWRRSFHGQGDNVPTDIVGFAGTQYRVNLHSSGIDIRVTSVIADGASSFIRLNANNEIAVTGADTQVNPDTNELEYTSSSKINSLAFFNNNRLETPDNGDSGVTFGLIKRSNGGVNLAGLWPTTNMGLPLTEQPTTAIWRGRLSTIYLGRYQGEKDARFTITFNGVDGGGTVTTTNEVFIAHENFASQYISIDAKFDYLGAISGSTSFATVKQIGGIDLSGSTDREGNRFTGRVSGLIGAKGLIGAFVTPHGTERHYVGGFYALNPDAEEKEAVVVSGPTNRGLWTASFEAGGDNDDDKGDTSRSKYAVNAFGGLAPAGEARFARRGTGSYRVEEQRIFDAYTTELQRTNNPIMSQVLLAGFADSNVDDNGVGFGRVGEGYYSGLLAGANAGISLGPNQEITGTATWSGKIALYGFGSGASNATFRPSEEEMDFDLDVTFNGTTGTIASSVMFDGVQYQFTAPQTLEFTLTIDGTFNAAGVIKGTTSFDTDRSGSVASAGVVTGLIGTRGAIGSFISTKVLGMPSRDIYAGIYAGGFVVQNPDYIVLKEIKPPVFGDDVELSGWQSASGAVPALFDRDRSGDPYYSPFSKTHFIKGTADWISNFNTIRYGISRLGTLELTDAKNVSAGEVVFAYFNGSANYHNFAGLLDNVNVGGAFTSNPSTAIWKGKFGGIVGANVAGEQNFKLHVTFDGTNGTVKSSDADGNLANIDFGDGEISFSGSFTSAGVITGSVTTPSSSDLVLAAGGGALYGLIGERGAIGVFKSNTVGTKAYVGGFTAANPDLGKVGVTPAYNRWRSSFDSRGLNGVVSHPTITGAKRPNTLQPRGVNVNQFLTGTTHFVQGTATGLNLTGSSIVTENFTPTLLTLEGNAEVGFALWQNNVNVAGDANVQGYVGLLISTDVGKRPSIKAGSTYTGTIRAYVGSQFAESDFTFTVDYSNNDIDGNVMLENTRFVFDGGFNISGVMSGDVSTGADGATSIQGSFNGLLGTESAVGVFKNTAGNTGGSFIGGFVAEPRVDFSVWTASFPRDALLPDDQATAREQSGSSRQGYFIRGTETGIKNITAADASPLTLESDSKSGVAFGEYHRDPHGAPSLKTYFAGLLSGTNVGRHIDNENLNGEWKGKISAYFDGELATDNDFSLHVTFTGTSDPDEFGTITANALGIGFNGTFNEFGVMSGITTYTGTPDSIGVFNGLIGTLGAVGVFKDNNVHTARDYLGGFVANPPTQ